MRRKILLGIFLFFVLCILYWLATHSFIAVNVPSDRSNVTFVVSDVSSGKSVTVKNHGNALKRLVRAGQYTVTATDSNGSFVAATKTGRFLSTTTIEAKTQPEKSRQFVGNNPSPCMYFNGKVLVSYNCFDRYNNVGTHVPATAKSPTYISKNTAGLTSYTEGIFKVSSGQSYVVLQSPYNSENGAHHYIYDLGKNLKIANGTEIRGLDPQKTYSFAPYKSGFLAYNASDNQYFYFASKSSSPSQLSIDKAKDNQLVAGTVDFKGDTLLVPYSNTYGDGGSKPHPDQKLEVVVVQPNQAVHYSFGQGYSTAKLCGTQKICLLGQGRLGVFAIDGKQPKFLYAMNDVKDIQNGTDGLYVVRDHDILLMDIDKQQGYIVYSLGDYEYVGLQPQSKGAILTVTNNKEKKVALLLNPSVNNTDSIDKTVAKLLKRDEITDVSAYGKYLYISPYYGFVIYNRSTDDFGYNPKVVKSVDKKLQQLYRELGITGSGYIVINPYDR